MKALIIGGNRFFGKRLAGLLLEKGHEVTLLNRGNLDDGFGNQVSRIQCDRTDKNALAMAMQDQTWDIVYDQVCYDYQTAKDACEVFKAKTKRYIHTSSESVYEAGPDLKEEDFSVNQYKFDHLVTQKESYAHAKRQAEVAFSKYASFPVVMVRFPIVIGHDDYTKRFLFHMNRIKEEKPIYFPNLEAKMSFVPSSFAAVALLALSENDYEGPLNVASPSPMKLSRFIEIIENAVGKKMIQSREANEENHSPYGNEKDWYMNCDRLKNLGLVGAEVEEWLPGLLTLF